MFLCDFHSLDCSSLDWHKQDASAILLCKAEKTERWLEIFYKNLMDAFSYIHLVFVNFCRVLSFFCFFRVLNLD